MLQAIETERMALEPLKMSDIDLLTELDSKPEVMRYIGSGKPRTREEVAASVQRRLQEPANGLGAWLAWTKENRDFVGLFLLLRLEESEHIEIGYRLMPAMWNKGFASEGARKIVKYAFEILNLKQVVAVAFPENMASRRVMEKIGMEYKGMAYYYERDLVFYTLDNSEDDFK